VGGVTGRGFNVGMLVAGAMVKLTLLGGATGAVSMTSRLRPLK
jgi:hypothetical protein